jgi:sugar lactone lactonase YvrE
VVAFAGGVSRWDGADDFEPLVQPDPFSGNRLNEGKCDSRGRFWVGSMQTNLNPDGSRREMTTRRGALFRYDGGRRCERLTAHEFGITNTMAWSPDERYFYCADTIRNVFSRYDYHPDGCWRNRSALRMVPASITMVVFGTRDSAGAVSCELHRKEK